MLTYKSETYNSKSSVKRWMHQKRFNDAFKLLNLKSSDTLLDYGCGDAHLLELCLKSVPAKNLCGFEPAKNMYEQAISNVKEKNIRITNSINNIQEQFSKIACLETCEHLNSNDLQKLLTNIESLLLQNGEVLISIPVEIGIPAFFKNIFRFIYSKNDDNLNFTNCFKSLFGINIVRQTKQKLSDVNYIYSHIGFDHRKFESLLKDHFKIKKIVYSPINIKLIGAALNNTIYYMCKKK